MTPCNPPWKPENAYGDEHSLTNTQLLASCLRAFRGRVEFEPWVLIKKLQSGFPRVNDPSTADTAIVGSSHCWTRPSGTLVAIAYSGSGAVRGLSHSADARIAFSRRRARQNPSRRARSVHTKDRLDRPKTSLSTNCDCAPWVWTVWTDWTDFLNLK